MMRRYSERVLVFAVASVVLSLIFGAVLGQPVLFSYVTSDSMAPTLDPGDGFVAVPTEIDGSPKVGEVVVFQSKEVGSGGLTTHRIVGKTEEGFFTRGDANPVTDQASGEPPVKRQQIVAKALRIGGKVVVLPALGVVPETAETVLSETQSMFANMLGYRLLQGPQGVAYLFFAATLFWYIYGEVRNNETTKYSKTTGRERGLDSRLVVGIAVSVLVIAATAAMVVPAGHHEYTFVSADYESEEATVIQRGNSAAIEYNLENRGFLPVVLFFEPSSANVNIYPKETEIPARSALNASITLHAPEEPGRYRRYVTEHRYLAVLPQSLIRAFYEVHPWLPIVVIDALIAVPFYLLGVRLVGESRIRRRRSRESSKSVVSRVWGFVTDLY